MSVLRKDRPVKLASLNAKPKRIAKRRATPKGRNTVIEEKSEERMANRDTGKRNKDNKENDDDMEIVEDETEPGIPLEVTLLNSSIVLYRYIIHAMFKASAAQIQGRNQSVALLEETDNRIKAAISSGSEVCILSLGHISHIELIMSTPPILCRRLLICNQLATCIWTMLLSPCASAYGDKSRCSVLYELSPHTFTVQFPFSLTTIFF